MTVGVLERVARGIDRIVNLGGILAAAAVVGILALVGLEVCLRAFFNTSTLISDEMSGYLNIAVVYFGLAYALKSGSFVRVEVVYAMFRGPWALLVRWLIVLASLAYVSVLGVYIWRYVVYNHSIGLVSTDISRTALWIPQSIVVVGMVVLGLQLVAFMLRGGRDVP